MHSNLLLQDFAVALLAAGLCGWLCRRLGLSAVVGFLIAGILIGPHTPPFALVSDVERVHTLSQMGLVFLMFFVGLGLSLERIRRMGLALFLTAFLGAMLVFFATQILAHFLHLTNLQANFLAAMFMVSSTAMITRSLLESGLTHHKAGQQALGISVVEDVVAVVMIALLTAQLSWGAAGAAAGGGGVMRTLGLLGGFTVLSVVVGLLLMSRLFQKLGRSNSDLLTILVAGLLFGGAWMAARMGYSVALGAFLFGVVIAETPFKARLEKAFGGAQEMFSALFFVSIGMLIDFRAFAVHWPLVLGLSVFAIGVRVLAAGTALIFTGSSVRQALLAALAVTPIGEFSYVIAQLGVNAGALPSHFYAVAVGVSLSTALLSPFLLRYGETLGPWLEKALPRKLQNTLEAYQDWHKGLLRPRKRHLFWKILRPRIQQVLLELMLIAGLLGFSGLGGELLLTTWPQSSLPRHQVEFLYWFVVTLAVGGLALMVWRNLDALSMILAEASLGTSTERAKLRTVLEGALRMLGAVALGWMIWLLAPVQMEHPWTNLLLLSVCLLLGWIFWRRLILWHSHFRISLQQALENKTPASGRGVRPSSTSAQVERWAVEIVECELPDDSRAINQSLAQLNLRAQFGTSVVEVERQGISISNPAPDFVLYPGDKLLLFGAEAGLDQTRQFLSDTNLASANDEGFDETALDTLMVPAESSRCGRSLAELKIYAVTGVQVLGIERAGERLLCLNAQSTLEADDTLLILGTTDEVRRFQEWLGR